MDNNNNNINNNNMNSNNNKIMNDENDDQNGIDFLNVFLVYYKKLHNKKSYIHMFHDIIYKNDTETNRCMEMLYNEMHKYEQSEKNEGKEIIIYNYENEEIEKNELSKCRELYVLTLNDEPVKICEMLLPLIKYVSELKWSEISWSINKIK